MADVKVKNLYDKNAYPKIVYPVTRADLHKAIMIEGVTETSIRPQKVKTLKAVGWTRNFEALVIVGVKDIHVVPSAGVSDSVLV